ncbi:acyl-ACP desaturase [Actinocrinis sp.]|uniref:acyl-ACP desaturase n=1 Tax=Actinocrinis sp. TaxID=1920516 RepID=UPI002C08B3DE|nr:acyl-ACP desaturase [Actinocrinis sp.]HXR70662.1 acyl-ACP desaturase [Actinocrinis sp.]
MPLPTDSRPTADAVDQTALLYELEPVVEENLNRHLAVAKEWFPHAYVPWSEGRDFDGPLGGTPWESGQSKLDETARTSLILNLLTEDNLPSYHHEIALLFGRDGAWGTWVHRWTAEEGRHGTAIRDYLLTTRAVDPIALERARMTHMSTGYVSPNSRQFVNSVAYVSFQELATRISHRNTGVYSGEPLCEQLLTRIAADENLHMIFYRNLLSAAFDAAPDATMEAVLDVVKGFQMPGATVENYTRKSVEIALAGIYNLRIHRDEVLVPVLRNVKALERTDLGPAGERAREELAGILDALDVAASRFEEKRDARLARRAESAQR